MNTLPALLLAAAGVGLGHAVMPDHWLPLVVLSRTRRYRTARVLRVSLVAALTHVAVSVLLGGILIVIGLQFRATVARHTDVFVGGILLVTGAVFLFLELRGKGHGHSHDRQGGQAEHNHDRAVDSRAHHDYDSYEWHSHDHDCHDHDSHDHDCHDHDCHDHDSHGWHSHDHAGHDHVGHDHVGHDHGGHVHGRAATVALERPESAPDKGAGRGLAGLLVPFGAAASPDLTILPVFLAASALGTTAALGSLAAFTAATAVTIAGLTTATALGARLFAAPWIDSRASLITALTLIAIGALAVSGVI